MPTIEQVIKEMREYAGGRYADAWSARIKDWADRLKAEVRRGPVAWDNPKHYPAQMVRLDGVPYPDKPRYLFAAPQPAIPDWRPIETAPRNAWVLVFAPITPIGGDHVIARASLGKTRDGEDVWWCEGAFFTPKEVTHWMPLPDAPPPPSGDAGKEGG